VDVVGGGDDHRVQVLGLVDHLPEVAELFCLRVLLGGFCEVSPVHVAERDDVLAGHLAQVLVAAAAEADEADVELIVGRFRLTESDPGDRAGRDTGRCGEELAS
jgi:hypothetical protein